MIHVSRHMANVMCYHNFQALPNCVYNIVTMTHFDSYYNRLQRNTEIQKSYRNAQSKQHHETHCCLWWKTACQNALLLSPTLLPHAS